MNEYIGKRGLVRLGTMQFAIIVRDVKSSYGVVRLLCEPENGTGKEWKDITSVELDSTPDNGTA